MFFIIKSRFYLLFKERGSHAFLQVVKRINSGFLPIIFFLITICEIIVNIYNELFFSLFGLLLVLYVRGGKARKGTVIKMWALEGGHKL